MGREFGIRDLSSGVRPSEKYEWDSCAWVNRRSLCVLPTKICDQLSVSVSQEELSRPRQARGSAGQGGLEQEERGRRRGGVEQERGRRRWGLLIFNPILPLEAYVKS